MKFLTAKWEHLLLANYSVDASLLEPYVPLGTRLDRFEGHIFVSLVAFMFNRTKVMGIPAFFHRDFEEVNLRFYVTPEKDESIRAVTFIQEIVPKRIIPLVSNSLFNENYVAVPMRHHNGESEHWYAWKSHSRVEVNASHSVGEFDGLPDRSQHEIFAAAVEEPLELPAPGSISEFITEHYWGYAKGKSSTLEYKVEHPQWICAPVNRYMIDVDFAAVYGSSFAVLNELAPYNVLYARGSDVSVSFPSRYRV
ncbi:MAG: DUF2071 domain-containing protein [Planctomycetota bacterium]